jgi:hypothetical protein
VETRHTPQKTFRILDFSKRTKGKNYLMMFGRLFGGKKGEQRQVHGNKGLNPTKKRPIVFLFFSHRKNKTNVERDSS